MKGGRAQTLDYKRKREGKTDYRGRLKLLSSGKLRVVIRKSLNNIYVQLVSTSKEGDKVLVSSSSRELMEYGWKMHRGNVPSAYLVGFLFGSKTGKSGLKEGVLDIGSSRAVRNSVFFAVAKGIVEGGFNVSVGEGALPKEDRVYGKHIEEYAKEGSAKNERQFSRYIKSGFNINETGKHVEEVKNKIAIKWQ